MRDYPRPGDDIIDSRDVIQAIEDLEAEKEQFGDEFDEAELLAQLKELDESVGGRDWRDGVTLIRDGYFETYAQELAEDIGAIGRDLAWPANCIDWERAARELQMDYSSAEFGGVDYWYL